MSRTGVHDASPGQDVDENGRLYGIEIIGMKGRIPIPELGKIILDFPIGGHEPAPA